MTSLQNARPRALRRRTAALTAGLVSSALVLSGCSVYDVPLPGGADTGEDPMKITVMFRDVLDLVPQSTVKVDDVTVGKVKSVKLKGYVAQVSIEVRKDLDLPDNSRAEIRQTSLLGEKFVSLSKPLDPGTGKLSDKDTIGLDRTGRNPEVEEVLGALSLLLNGGGVGQLKTIVSEVNNALGGRESEVRSVLDQIRTFMGQLDQNKGSIVAAIENTNRLAVQLRRQDRTIKSALDNVPDTLRSVNRQREDLVKLLQALSRLSGVGTRVIKASKDATINTLRDLAPVLDSLGKAGQNLPEAFQVLYAYPFIDEAVGRDPQVARNLHMGDYTNLAINLDLSLATLQDLIGAACGTVDRVLTELENTAGTAADQILEPLVRAGVPQSVLDNLRKNLVTEIVNQFRKEAIEQCKAPDLGRLVTFGLTQLQTLIGQLPVELRNLLAGVSRIGTVLNGVVAGLGDSLGLANRPRSGAGAGGGGGGGIKLPKVPLLPRPGLSAYSDKPEQVDPFGLESYGLDPGIGTMLFQGVAEVR